MRILAPSLFAVLPVATFANDLHIVTDIAPIHSLVAMIAGPDVRVDVLVSGAASPHDFQFTFDQAQMVQDANLVIWAGADLTPWLAEALETLAPDIPTLELLETDTWAKLDLRMDAAFETHDHDHGDHEHEHDHDAHDEHSADADHTTDPHAWLDPRVAVAWQASIAQVLTSIHPEGGATYAANLDASTTDMAALQSTLQARFSDIPQGPYLVPHDAYQYFEQLIDRPAIGAIALSDAVAPSPARIAELQELVADAGVVCVLTDPQSRAEWGDLVREGTQARTALVDPMGGAFDLGADHYPQTLAAVADAFAGCLKG